jgi:outer membrane lipoprotein-sorting protein
MRLFRSALMCVAVLGPVFGLPVALSANDDPLAGVFARMDQASAKLKDLTADMQKISYDAPLKEQTVDVGKIAVKVPKRHQYLMLLDFREPDKKQVAVRGTTVEIYYPNSKLVQEMQLGKANRSEVESLALLGFGSNSKDLLDAYTVTYGGPETIGDQKTARIELIPKSKDVAAQFPKFELWISDQTGISVQQKMHMLGGDYSLATYSNMKINQNLPDSAVKLNLPRGVQRERLQK